jgi:hypothetical protein
MAMLLHAPDDENTSVIESTIPENAELGRMAVQR